MDGSRCGPVAVMSKAVAVLVLVSNVLLVSSKQGEQYGPGEFGSLTLCPPGGASFMMAWGLACEMKRRKRALKSFYREVRGYRPATLTEIQKICCEVGCEIRDLLSYCDPFGPWNS